MLTIDMWLPHDKIKVERGSLAGHRKKHDLEVVGVWNV